MLLDERPTPSVSEQAPRSPSAPVDEPRAGSWRPTAGLVAGSLVLAVLAFTLPGAPTYDPWAWIVWGREITQADLSTTDGPSWKPLPVLLTTPFALFGSAAPDLWLVVARAGMFAAIGLAFVLARRLGGGIPGGVAAAAALALAPWMYRNGHLGNSEPLLIALGLGAIIRALDGDHRGAFALGVAAGLLRPEVWPFLAVYGLWLILRRRLAPHWVLGAGAVVVALWTLPELWGSGDPLHAITRAQEPNAGAPTFEANPAWEILRNAFGMVPWSVEAGLVAAGGLLVVRRDRRLTGVLLLAVAWLALVAAMTAGGGFAGNTRYVMPPVALLVVVAGAGAGATLNAAAAAALRRVSNSTARGGRNRHSTAVVAVSTVLLGLGFGLANLGQLNTTRDLVAYQVQVTDDLGPLIDRAGGADALNACGAPYTGAFMVPQVAWELGLHGEQVALEPERPAVILRVRTLADRGVAPALPEALAPTRTLAEVQGRWRVVTACGDAP